MIERLMSMFSRLETLATTVEGLRLSGVPLVSHNGQVFTVAGIGDDPGLFYFIPRFMQLTGLDLRPAVILSMFLMVGLSFSAGALGVWLLKNNRVWAIANLFLLMVLSLAAWNVYTVSACAIVATVPLTLYFVRRGRADKVFIGFFLIAGFLLQYANMLRLHSGTAALLFLVILIAMEKRFTIQRRSLLMGCLALGLVLVSFQFASLRSARNEFLQKNQPDASITDRHVFWHSAVVGLSYLTTHYELPNEDGEVQAWVDRMDPQAGSFTPAYERAARRIFFMLVLDHPYHFVRTFFSKSGVLFFYALVFANLGALALIKNRLPLSEKLAFWVALTFAALPGWIVTPYHFYVLGFIALLSVFAPYAHAHRETD